MAARLFVSRMTGPEVEEALRRAMSAVQTINGIHPTRSGNVFVEGVQEEGADGSIISAVYTPYMEDGVLYWENNAGLENPEPVVLTDFLPEAVYSVNGKHPENGAVTLTAGDVGAQILRESIVLPASGWADSAQTVSVSGVTADAGVIVAPDPGDDGNFTAYLEGGVRCVSQGAGTLTFRCERAPGVDLTVNLQIHEGALPQDGGSLPTYAGPYAVTPTVAGASLPTARKQMAQDVTVRPIPYYDVGNAAGGSTVYIGKEV